MSEMCFVNDEEINVSNTCCNYTIPVLSVFTRATLALFSPDSVCVQQRRRGSYNWLDIPLLHSSVQ